jgi:hypothetical protein
MMTTRYFSDKNYDSIIFIYPLTKSCLLIFFALIIILLAKKKN